MRSRIVALLLLTILVPAAGHAAPAAPGFRVKTLDGGQTLDSRTLIGKKILVLRFQASYCKPCGAESAPLGALAERYRARGVEVWAIHVQDTAADARAWVEAQKAPYLVALDPKLTIANRYGFKGAPYTVVVDRKGEIAWRLRGESAPTRLPRVLDVILAREKQPSRKL
ncbi:MAG: TlpA disulfide reductase family protein [Candidatus Rokuibacteriota bacterium]